MTTKRSKSTFTNGKEQVDVARGSLAKTRKIARDLSARINDPLSNERDLKAFFDKYPGALPTQWLLNHGLHFDFIFPEYQIGPRFKCDYMYLTKSSGEWWCVLVEIERPQAKLFRVNGKDVKTGSELNLARDQINDWREYLSKNKGTFMRDLAPILFPFSMSKNPLNFRYVLLIGRTADFRNDPRNAARLATLNADGDTQIMTYDSTLSDFRYEHLKRPYSDRNLLVAYGGPF